MNTAPRTPVGLVACVLLAACASTDPRPAAPGDGPSPREAALLEELRAAERARLERVLALEEAGAVEASAPVTSEELAEARRTVQAAELHLRLVREAGEARRAALELEHDLATRRLALAEEALAHFDTLGAKLAESRAQLTLDRAAARVEEAEALLESEGETPLLEAELALSRRERVLAAAERGDLLEHGLPARRAALELSVEEAAGALLLVEAELGRVSLENGLEVGRARAALAAERAALEALGGEPEPRS